MAEASTSAERDVKSLKRTHDEVGGDKDESEKSDNLKKKIAKVNDGEVGGDKDESEKSDNLKKKIAKVNDGEVGGDKDESEKSDNLKKKITKENHGEEPCDKGKDSASPNFEFSSFVANHYNELENTGMDMRKESKIFYMRNFNNWIKSVLINVYVTKSNRVRNVLDLCCGKGGDLRKWQRANINHLICADIAEISVEQCRSRYEEMESRMSNIFSCEFITADCTRVCLKEKFQNPDIELDLVSCQFSFHYCFESLPQAERMLKNASDCLKKGGYFIGTMPHANEIVKRIRKSGGKILKNKIFELEMCSEEPYPLFGAQYDFHLDSVVGCPEFLVHFPTLVKLAEKYGLKLDYRDSFANFYLNHWLDNKKQFLLKKMFALEPYSHAENKDKPKDEYIHAEKYCQQRNYSGKLGTISQSEWEAISLYEVFAFVKISGNDDKDGNSVKNSQIPFGMP